MRKKVSLFLLFFGVIASLSVQAKVMASAKSISEFMDISGMGPVVNQSLDLWRLRTLKELNEKLKKELPETQKLSAKQQQLQIQGFKKITDSVNYFHSWNYLKQFSIQVYQKTFTQKEMDDLIAFAKTPTGKTYWKKNRDIDVEQMALGEARGVAYIGAIYKALDKLILDVKSLK